MVNISHFDCDVLSSNLSPASVMLALAYLVKRLSVQQGNRVRAPESTRGTEEQMDKEYRMMK